MPRCAAELHRERDDMRESSTLRWSSHYQESFDARLPKLHVLPLGFVQVSGGSSR